ncbi:MAG: hypothetical protein ACSLE1_00770 [Sphingobium sp.]
MYHEKNSYRGSRAHAFGVGISGNGADRVDWLHGIYRRYGVNRQYGIDRFDRHYWIDWQHDRSRSNR